MVGHGCPAPLPECCADHEVTVDSEQFVEIDSKFLASGEVGEVADTVMDLRSPTVMRSAVPRCPGGEYAGFR